MNKEKEEKIKEKLTSLSKEDVELYFQKCCDYEILWDDLVKENQQLKQQLQGLIKDLKILNERSIIDVNGYKILWLYPDALKKIIDSLIKKYEVEK